MNYSELLLRFAGTWQLQAGASEYVYGTPPTSGLYRIEPSGDDLFFTIEWTDDCGHTHSVRYSITPDGREYAYERPDIADTVMARFVGEHTLETFAMKNGRVALFAERLLADDGASMVVKQKGTMPDGQEFCNVQHYVRVRSGGEEQ